VGGGGLGGGGGWGEGGGGGGGAKLHPRPDTSPWYNKATVGGPIPYRSFCFVPAPTVGSPASPPEPAAPPGLDSSLQFRLRQAHIMGDCC